MQNATKNLVAQIILTIRRDDDERYFDDRFYWHIYVSDFVRIADVCSVLRAIVLFIGEKNFMSKRMLIDATHPEETRVVVTHDGRLEELDVDTSTKKQIKGNIYLAKVVRVEPSLQAAFIEYGGNRHGFLAFGEIHPDYYQIPIADREALKELIAEKDHAEDEPFPDEQGDVEEISETEEAFRMRPFFLKKYKIQEVIRQGQVMLVQVVKEERGNKGAALTTYLSLAGRFSVLMPNNGKGGGVSRKITNVKDRKTMREIVEKLPIPKGMSVIIRTAGQGKTKSEIKRDYDYLIKTWTKIRDLTLESIAPKLIHEEGDIIKRSLRDVFTTDIDEIFIEGEEIFKSTKAFMKLLMPSQVKKIKQYKGDLPLFQQYQIESQLEAIHNNVVQLKSGGYLVIDQTEALVAVDVNSGRATREHDIEETALKTNLETCEELARQLKLRDLAGLVVIDFIDMDEPKNNATVERALKEALKKDRARIQVGRISGFGLMEMSRQRLHSSFLESSYKACPHCGGKGMIRSVESCAMHALHLLEDSALKNTQCTIVLSLPLSVATYLLNNKRENLLSLEKKYDVTLQVLADTSLLKTSDFKLERLRSNTERTVLHQTTDTPIRSRNERDKKERHAVSDKKNAVQDKKKEENSHNRHNHQKRDKEQKESVDIIEEVNDTSLVVSDEEKGSQTGEKKLSARAQKRRDWRRRIKEKRRARQQLVEQGNAPLPVLTGEENFTVVSQETASQFEENQTVIPAEVTIPETDSVDQQIVPQKSGARRGRRRKNPVSTSVSQESGSENIEAPSFVPADKTSETPIPPKRKGWWNKLVN